MVKELMATTIREKKVSLPLSRNAQRAAECSELEAAAGVTRERRDHFCLPNSFAAHHRK